MKRTVLLLILLASCCFRMAAQTAGENIDTKHYEIHLNNLDFTENSIEAQTLVTFEATANTSSIVLELKELTVSAVTSDDISIAGFSQNGDLLVISLQTPMTAGSNATIAITYGGPTFSESWGGFHWSNGIAFNLGVGFDSQPHNLGKAWFPCVDNFTDKASYDVFITADTSMTAVSGGILVGTTDNNDGTTTWHWKTEQEIATYHISATISKYELWEDSYQGLNGTIPINVYAKPSQIGNVPGSFVNIKGICNFFEQCFGAYPFNRVGYVSTPIGCMEHIDNIALASSIINGNTTEEEYIAHELSHMWFGNKVTCSTAGDMWLNEGFAQFCGLYYRSAIYGEDDFHDNMSTLVNSVVNWTRSPNNWMTLNNMPLDMTYDSRAVYDRGAAITYTMMNYVGKDLFLEGIRHYLDKFAYGAASSEDLRDALTESTGVDMNGFFDTWVFSAGMPHFGIDSYNVVENGNQYEVHINMRYQHLGASHVGQHNIYEIAYMDQNRNIITDTVCWNGLTGSTVKTLDFEPVAVFGDYYNEFADARAEQNFIISTTGKKSFNYFEAQVNAIENDEFLRVEAHFVGPEDDPEIPGVTMSDSHYWTIWRENHDDADIDGSFVYSATMDADIIQSESDSAIILYRRDATEAWHFIPFTYYGTYNWRLGKIIVEDIPSGDYAIAAFDKDEIGISEFMQPSKFHIFPNPANEVINVKLDNISDGMLIIRDQNARTMMEIPFSATDSFSFKTLKLPKGLYHIECRDKQGGSIGNSLVIIR